MNVEMRNRDVVVQADDKELPGLLTVPEHARGLVIFAHGSGSSRLSRRNQQVAQTLVDRNCATLLFDLLTEGESQDRDNVFDIELLGRRMLDATRWAQQHEDVGSLAIGYFGASTGAAAALTAAAELTDDVAAVVSRGGRPDLAGGALPRVTAPTLLIIGSLDTQVLELNRMAEHKMTCTTELVVIDGATHLFEEPGTLEQVADRAGAWLVRWFGKAES